MHSISRRLITWWHVLEHQITLLFQRICKGKRREDLNSYHKREIMTTKTIKADISLCKPKRDPLLFDNGKITISDDSIVVSGCLDREHAGMFSVAYKAGINLHPDLENFVKYKKATDDGQPIKIINEEGARALSVKTRSIANGGSEYTWSLSKLSLSYSSTTEENYVVLIPDGKLLFA